MDDFDEKTKWRIALRAFELYELRGCQDGFDLENWIQAESEILGKLKAGADGEESQARDVKTAGE